MYLEVEMLPGCIFSLRVFHCSVADPLEKRGPATSVDLDDPIKRREQHIQEFQVRSTLKPKPFLNIPLTKSNAILVARTTAPKP